MVIIIQSLNALLFLNLKSIDEKLSKNLWYPYNNNDSIIVSAKMI